MPGGAWNIHQPEFQLSLYRSPFSVHRIGSDLRSTHTHGYRSHITASTNTPMFPLPLFKHTRLPGILPNIRYFYLAPCIIGCFECIGAATWLPVKLHYSDHYDGGCGGRIKKQIIITTCVLSPMSMSCATRRRECAGDKPLHKLWNKRRLSSILICVVTFRPFFIRMVSTQIVLELGWVDIWQNISVRELAKHTKSTMNECE